MAVDILFCFQLIYSNFFICIVGIYYSFFYAVIYVQQSQNMHIIEFRWTNNLNSQNWTPEIKKIGHLGETIGDCFEDESGIYVIKSETLNATKPRWRPASKNVLDSCVYVVVYNVVIAKLHAVACSVTI